MLRFHNFILFYFNFQNSCFKLIFTRNVTIVKFVFTFQKIATLLYFISEFQLSVFNPIVKRFLERIHSTGSWYTCTLVPYGTTCTIWYHGTRIPWYFHTRVMRVRCIPDRPEKPKCAKKRSFFVQSHFFGLNQAVARR